MPVIQFTAGSLGDILAVAGLTIKVITKLCHSRKSQEQHSHIIHELKAFEETLLAVHATLDEVISNHTYIRTSTSALQIACLIKSNIDESRVLLQEFLNNLIKYEVPLNSVGLRSVWTKVWWAMWEGDQLLELQKRIAGYNQRIMTLFHALNANSLSTLVAKANISIPGSVSDPVRHRQLELEVRRARILKGERPTFMNGVSETPVMLLLAHLWQLFRAHNLTLLSGRPDNTIFKLTLDYLDLLSFAYYTLTVARGYEQYNEGQFVLALEKRIRDGMESEATVWLFEAFANGITPQRVFPFVRHVLSLIFDLMQVMVSRRTSHPILPGEGQDVEHAFEHLASVVWLSLTRKHVRSLEYVLPEAARTSGDSSASHAACPEPVMSCSYPTRFVLSTAAETQLQFIQSLPKAELHARLVDSIPIHVLQDLAAKHSLSPSTDAILQKLADTIELFKDELVHIRSIIDLELVSTPKAVTRATKAVISSYLDLQTPYASGSIDSSAMESRSSLLSPHCTYVELRVMLRETRHMSREVYLRTVLSTISASGYGPSQVGIVVSLHRRMPRTELFETMSILKTLKSKGGEDELGVYLVGIEILGDPGTVEVGVLGDICEQAKACGLGIILYVEEGINVTEDEMLKLLSFEPDRVNGSALIHDTARKMVYKNRMCVEISSDNLIAQSQLALNVTKLARSQHPVAICSIAPTLRYTNLTAEYTFYLTKEFLEPALTEDEIKIIAQTSLDSRLCVSTKIQD